MVVLTRHATYVLAIRPWRNNEFNELRRIRVYRNLKRFFFELVSYALRNVSELITSAAMRRGWQAERTDTSASFQ